MTAKFFLVTILFLAFGAYSGWVIFDVGYLGIWKAGAANPDALQVLLDLVIVCVLASGWMVRDARTKGRKAWPYVLLTLAAGSFGPMLYVLVGELRGVDAGAGGYPATAGHG